MRTLLLATLCTLGVVACGSGAGGQAGSSSTPSSTATRTVTRSGSSSSSPTSPTSPTSASTTPTTSTSATASTSAPAVAGGACVAADLSLSFLGGQGATGHGELGFALRNTSSSSCTTGGYPGILFLDGAGRALPTTPEHTTDDFFGHTVLRELTVAAGASVSFRLGVSHVGSGGSSSGCVSASALQVIAPNDTATLRIAVRGGIAECGGTVTVSPLQPGDTAFH